MRSKKLTTLKRATDTCDIAKVSDNSPSLELAAKHWSLKTQAVRRSVARVDQNRRRSHISAHARRSLVFLPKTPTGLA